MKRYRYIFLLLLLVFTAPSIQAKKQKPELKVGILSDVHLSGAYQDSIFIKALEYFKMNDVDAVILAGDYANNGLEVELAKAARLWFSVFPDDKGKKGKHVERIFVYGNHELEGHTYNDNPKKFSEEFIQQNAIVNHREEFWKKYWKKDFEPFYMVTVKGYVFIAAQYVEKWVSPGEIPGMKEYFDKIGPQLPKDKPVFYVQHKHPKWTAGYAQDNGKSTRILKQYPNIICFSGHCHSPLTDERSIWQGSFTSVNTGSLKSLGIKSGRENSYYKDGYVSQMGTQPARWKNGHHGMLMEVFPDKVVLHRHDFYLDEDIADWVIPTDTSLRPYSIEARKAAGAANPPVFDKRAAVTTERVLGKNRKKEPTEQVRVYFPAVLSTAQTPRAFDYEVSVEKILEDGSTEVVKKKTVFSQHYHQNEAREKEHEVACYFAVEELPTACEFRFAIRPRDSFGNCGLPIYSKNMTL